MPSAPLPHGSSIDIARGPALLVSLPRTLIARLPRAPSPRAARNIPRSISFGQARSRTPSSWCWPPSSSSRTAFWRSPTPSSHRRRRQLRRCRRRRLPAPARVRCRRHLQHVLLTDRKVRKQGCKETRKQRSKKRSKLTDVLQ